MSTRTKTRPPSALAARRSSPKGPSALGRVLALAAAALVVGVPATAAGLAIGIPHAVQGLSPAAGLGLVALLVGLTTLGGAAVKAWRHAHLRGRIGVVLTGLLIVQFLLFPMSQAVFATNRAPMPLPSRTPADAGLSYEEVSLTTSDDVRLAGWYVPSNNGAAVVLLHGSGSTRVDVLAHAAALAAEGYGVLLLDARGHGDSGGRAMDFGWFGDADIAPAVDHLLAAPDVTEDRIALVGMSMGGEQAIGAAASMPSVRAVVAEGVTGRVGADWLPLRPAGIGRAFSKVFYWVQDATAAALSRTSPPMDLRSAVVETAPRPVLVIAGGDVTDERAAGQRLHRAAGNVQLWEVKGAEHTAGLRVAREEWTSRVVTFLDAALDVQDD